jgi:signal transduction histidine kinase
MNKNAARITEKQVLTLSSIIQKTSKEMLQQLNELVTWAMKQREKSRFSPCRLNLRKEVDQSLELLISFANQKNIRLENLVEEDICIDGDEHMLRSIMQNVITNAIKFTPMDGQPICITAVPINNMVEVCITDSGSGMTEETKHTLLNIYNMSSKIDFQQKQSNGLGLLLVKEFVSQHGGQVTIESQIDVGTKFKFTLPGVAETELA